MSGPPSRRERAHRRALASRRPALRGADCRPGRGPRPVADARRACGRSRPLLAAKAAYPTRTVTVTRHRHPDSTVTRSQGSASDEGPRTDPQHPGRRAPSGAEPPGRVARPGHPRRASQTADGLCRRGLRGEGAGEIDAPLWWTSGGGHVKARPPRRPTSGSAAPAAETPRRHGSAAGRGRDAQGRRGGGGGFRAALRWERAGGVAAGLEPAPAGPARSLGLRRGKRPEPCPSQGGDDVWAGLGRHMAAGNGAPRCIHRRCTLCDRQRDRALRVNAFRRYLDFRRCGDCSALEFDILVSHINAACVRGIHLQKGWKFDYKVTSTDADQTIIRDPNCTQDVTSRLN